MSDLRPGVLYAYGAMSRTDPATPILLVPTTLVVVHRGSRLGTRGHTTVRLTRPDWSERPKIDSTRAIGLVAIPLGRTDELDDWTRATDLGSRPDELREAFTKTEQWVNVVKDLTTSEIDAPFPIYPGRYLGSGVEAAVINPAKIVGEYGPWLVQHEVEQRTKAENEAHEKRQRETRAAQYEDFLARTHRIGVKLLPFIHNTAQDVTISRAEFERLLTLAEKRHGNS